MLISGMGTCAEVLARNRGLLQRLSFATVLLFATSPASGQIASDDAGWEDWQKTLVSFGLVGVAGLAFYLMWRWTTPPRDRSPLVGEEPLGVIEVPPPSRHPTSVAPPGARASDRLLLFISYRREDSADITGPISDRLVQKFGREAVFKDVDSIPLGRDFRKHLHDAVSQCDILLAIIGRNWCHLGSGTGRRLDDHRDHLRIELEAALERDIPVIPILVQGAELPPEDQLPESLRSLAYRQALCVRSDPDFNNDIDRLIRGIESQFVRKNDA